MSPLMCDNLSRVIRKPEHHACTHIYHTQCTNTTLSFVPLATFSCTLLFLLALVLHRLLLHYIGTLLDHLLRLPLDPATVTVFFLKKEDDPRPLHLGDAYRHFIDYSQRPYKVLQQYAWIRHLGTYATTPIHMMKECYLGQIPGPLT